MCVTTQKGDTHNKSQKDIKKYLNCTQNKKKAFVDAVSISWCCYEMKPYCWWQSGTLLHGREKSHTWVLFKHYLNSGTVDK